MCSSDLLGGRRLGGRFRRRRRRCGSHAVVPAVAAIVPAVAAVVTAGTAGKSEGDCRRENLPSGGCLHVPPSGPVSLIGWGAGVFDNVKTLGALDAALVAVDLKQGRLLLAAVAVWYRDGSPGLGTLMRAGRRLG